MPDIPLDKLSKSISDGILVTIRVSPKSHQDAIRGIVELPHDRLALGVRVSPPAADGAANEAVVEVLAKVFRVSRSCVEITSGATGRVKTVFILGNHLVLRAMLTKSVTARPLQRQ